ncbi:metallophosphoesterase family protein [Falsiroseomonas sp. HW251]|uniref:metallophosphoesterase family protein n=1 Tax=Falsiroseomonas sp. HW251 TaxID=3390998 RepID=UPI003D324456
MSGGIIFYGDPHGEWRPLLRACREERPEAVVILGDCDLDRPLSQEVAPIAEAGIPVRWIHGNHDIDRPEWHDNLWGDRPGWNLHATAATFGGRVVVGLGGVFNKMVWDVRAQDAQLSFLTRRDMLKATPPSQRWRGGLPLRARDAIFLEDIEKLQQFHADILVTHEAPSSHRHGYSDIDEAAKACRAKLVVHGHHHENYEGVIPDTDVQVRGLARATVFRLR